MSGGATDPPVPPHPESDLRKVQGAASREKLLAAATELFSERGISATGVDAVCRRAGVVKSALYWHFRSKEGLVAAVLDRVGRDWVDEIRASVRKTGDDPFERLDCFVAALQELIESRPELLRLLLAVTLERAEGTPTSREAVTQVFARSRDAIAHEIDDASGIGPDPSTQIAEIALGLVIALAVRRLLVPTTPLDPLFQQLHDVLLHEINHEIRRQRR